ncbi:MAG: tripartite tricarboxylate transporter substrate binding protein [Burkholderiales bacterium]
MKTHWLTVLTVSLYAAMSSGICGAQAPDDSAKDFPSGPIRILVGFAPGGLPDIAARIVAGPLSVALKQPVFVENRPGAGATIAAKIVADSRADGQTLLSVTSAHAAAPALYAKLSYDPARDFAGVAMFGTNTMLLIASPSLGVKSVPELIALSKAKPGQLNFASAGTGSNTHFSMEVFKSMAGIDVVHVPYKGITEPLTEIMTGRMQLFMAPFGTVLAQVKSGKVLALASTGTRRNAALPDVPTVAESGVPSYHWIAWFGLLAPAKTPRAVVAKLHGEITRILEQPVVRERWAKMNVEITPTTPEQFDKIIRDEIVTYKTAGRLANIKAE